MSVCFASMCVHGLCKRPFRRCGSRSSVGHGREPSVEFLSRRRERGRRFSQTGDDLPVRKRRRSIDEQASRNVAKSDEESKGLRRRARAFSGLERARDIGERRTVHGSR